jgi:predicted negative regulator of RcsB-dependent stress response
VKIRKHEQGFSIVEALLILVIVGILGFVGWFVWHSQKATDKAYSSAANDSTQKTFPIKTYAECEKAVGSKTLLTYPAQCITKSGKTFTDPTHSLK